MKKFEQLKQSELEAMRRYDTKDLYKKWTRYGAHNYLVFRELSEVTFDTAHFRIGRVDKTCSYASMRRFYPEWSPTNNWFVEARYVFEPHIIFAKCFPTLRAAWNAARKILIAARKGEPKYVLNQ